LRRYDLIVVGSGPSGSRVASLCAAQGMEVLLIEKGTHPRSKCCAGGLLERALVQLDDLPDSLVERELDSFVLVRGEESVPCTMGRRIGVTVRRDLFDAHLAGEAERQGAELLEGCTVLSARELQDAVEIRTERKTFHSRFLALAEGSRGRLASSLLGPRRPGAIALGSVMNCEVERTPDTALRIHLFQDRSASSRRQHFPLNGASFPLVGGFTISAVANHVERARMRVALDSMIKCIDDEFSVTDREAPCFHPIPLAQRPKVSSRRALAVGDAAGFVSPFSGEGLTYALKSAELASGAIRRAAEGKGDLLDYQRECWRHIGFNIRAAEILGPALRWITDLTDINSLVEVFSRDEALIEIVAQAAGGERDWRNILLRVIPRFPRLFFSSV